MESPPIIRPTHWYRNPVTWILLALIVVVAAWFFDFSHLRTFYIETKSYAPGTEIRPIGLALFLGLSDTASILIGGAFAIIGIFLGYRQRRWWMVLAASITLVVTWSPSIISTRGSDYIVKLRQLVPD